MADCKRERSRSEGRVSGPSARHARAPATAAETPLLYGLHPVVAALANPARRCRRLWVTAEARRALEARLAGGLVRTRVEVTVATRAEIERLLPRGAVHQGAALAADPLPERELAEALGLAPARGRKHGRVVVLDQVSDPQNVGAVLRSAAAFGASAVVITHRRAPESTGALAKAASGALEAVPLARVANLARALAELKELGYWCLGLEAGADHTLAEAAPDGPIALVLGAEGRGLRRLTRARCDLLVRLPTSPDFPTLNVSNAAACALYELARRA